MLNHFYFSKVLDVNNGLVHISQGFFSIDNWTENFKNNLKLSKKSIYCCFNIYANFKIEFVLPIESLFNLGYLNVENDEIVFHYNDEKNRDLFLIVADNVAIPEELIIKLLF